MTAATAPDLRVLLDAPAVDRACAAVVLDLHSALSVLGFFDGVYLVVSDMPAGARLSAGRCNGDFTWSLLPDELDGLQLLLPMAAAAQCLLTVNIVTPDPLGYDFASTAAQFNVSVKDGLANIPFNSMRRLEAAQGGWPSMLRRARATQAIHGKTMNLPQQRTDASDDDARLAAAKAEWEADEDMRLARARARWQADAEAIWEHRAAGLVAQHKMELRESETRSKERESERLALAEAMWSARLAAAEIHWQSGESDRITAAIMQHRKRSQGERLRRAAAWVLFTVVVGSMVLA